MQTRIIGRAHHSVNPSALPLREEKTKPPAFSRGQLYGRYKTRTCDLHDVNVAL